MTSLNLLSRTFENLRSLTGPPIYVEYGMRHVRVANSRKYVHVLVSSKQLMNPSLSFSMYALPSLELHLFFPSLQETGKSVYEGSTKVGQLRTTGKLIKANDEGVRSFAGEVLRQSVREDVGTVHELHK